MKTADTNNLLHSFIQIIFNITHIIHSNEVLIRSKSVMRYWELAAISGLNNGIYLA